MRTRTMMIVMVLAVTVSVGLFADDTDLVGRDIAREGRLTEVSGTLAYRSDEWFLDAPDSSYELHMGPFGHEESMPFVAGADARVHGFVVPDHIAPITVTSNGETHSFWHEDRYPLWAGNGARRNEVVESGERIGAETARGLALGRVDDDARFGRAAESAEQPEFGRRTTDEFEQRFRNQDLRSGQGR